MTKTVFRMLYIFVLLFTTYSRRHKKVPVPYSYYDRKTLRSVKRYDPITVQIVITVVYLLRNRAVFTGK